MEWSWPEIVLSNRERVMEELIQGRELASQLSKAFDNRSLVNGDDWGSAEGIVNKILGSFVSTLLIINGKESVQEFVSDQIQGNSSGVSGGGSGGGSGVGGGGSGVGDGGSDGGGGAYSSSADANHDHAAAMKSEDCTEEEISCKSTLTFEDGRASYKRRKTSHSWTRDTPALIADGHAWRKYGQKIIHNAKHPRNYFRCTHKYDQACKATKHVQQVQDHPPVFRTIYYGIHKCRDYLKTSELLLDCTSPRDSSQFISFENVNCMTNKQEHPFFASFASSSVKEEVFVKEDMPTTDHMVTSDHNHSSPCDHLVSRDLTAFESSGPMSGFSSSIDQYDHDDVFSGMIAESYFNIYNEVLQYGF